MVALDANCGAVAAVTAACVTGSVSKFLCTGNKRRRGGRRGARANDGRRGGPCRTSVAVRQSQATLAPSVATTLIEHTMAAPPGLSLVLVDPEPCFEPDKIMSSAQGADVVSVAVVEEKQHDEGNDRDACCDDENARAAAAAATLLRRLTGTGANVSLDDAVAQWCTETEKAAEARLLSVQDKNHLHSNVVSRNSQGDVSKRRRHVTFDDSVVTVHKITAYEEVYGLHPREFVFGRNFCIMPAAGPYGFVDVAAAAAQASGLLSHDDEELSSDDTDSDFDWDESETVVDVAACHGPSPTFQDMFCETKAR